LYAIGLRAQIRSRGVPRQSKVVAARLAITAPKNKKMPIAVNPCALDLTTSPHLLNISQRPQCKASALKN
jgi:hypothetical protein